MLWNARLRCHLKAAKSLVWGVQLRQLSLESKLVVRQNQDASGGCGHCLMNMRLKPDSIVSSFRDAWLVSTVGTPHRLFLQKSIVPGLILLGYWVFLCPARCMILQIRQ